MLHIEDYILFVFLIIAFITDVKYHKLPNWLTVSAMGFGIMFHLIAGGIDGLTFSFFGFLTAGGIFIILHFFKGVGAGDVKLFAAIGAFVGTQMVLNITMYTIIFAGLIAIIILLVMKTFIRNMVNAFISMINSIISKNMETLEKFKMNKGTQFPFMIAVIPAIAVSYFKVLT